MSNGIGRETKTWPRRWLRESVSRILLWLLCFSLHLYSWCYTAFIRNFFSKTDLGRFRGGYIRLYGTIATFLRMEYHGN